MTNTFTRAVLTTAAVIICTTLLKGQVAGDYRSKSTLTTGWSWATASNWETFNGTSWNTATTAPNASTNVTSGTITLQAGVSPTTQVTGNSAVTNTGTLVINSTVQLNIGNVLFTVTNININGGTLKASGSQSLIVKGNMSIDATNGGSFLGNGGIVDFQGTTTLSGGSAASATNSFTFSNITVTSTLNLGTSYIKLSGNLINNGTFNGQNSTVEFNQVSADKFINNSATMLFNDIYINNGSGFSVNNIGTGDTQLQGTLSFNATGGGFSADGGGGGVFTVLSTSLTDHARIAQVPAGNFTGITNIQRYINGKAGGDYRYVSMPIIDGTVSLWKTAFGVTGNFSDHSTHADFANINDGGNTVPSVYYFDPVAQAYVAVDAVGTPTSGTMVDNTKGYALYNFRDAGDNIAAVYTGTIASGDVQVTISSVAGSSNNFDLIPNPYPSPVSWDKIYADNPAAVNGSMWLRTGNGVYTSTYVGSLSLPPDPLGGVIAIGQAFWVQSAGGSSSITMHETDKSALDPTFVRKASPGNYVIFTMSSPSQKDYAAIRFVSNGTDGHDKDWDAVKRANGDYSASLGRNTFINLSTFTSSSSDDYAINSVAEISGCSKVFGLKVKDVPTGDYSFDFEDFSTMQLPYNLVLVDHFLNQEKIISEGSTYPFSVTADATSYGDARFEIRFETAARPVISVQGQTLTSSISSGNQWYKDNQIITGATNSTYTPTASGVYSVKTTTSGGCVGTSDNLTMSITGLPEMATSSIIYPNPTSGIVIINLPPDLDASLTGVHLYDLQGKVLLNSNNDKSLLKQGEKSLDLTNFKGGVYILNIASGSQLKSIRLIKK